MWFFVEINLHYQLENRPEDLEIDLCLLIELKLLNHQGHCRSF